MKAFISLLTIVCLFFACMLCVSYLLINPFTEFSHAIVWLLFILFSVFSVSTFAFLELI